MSTIKIEIGSLVLTAELNNSHTAGIIYESLPLEGRALIWGEEIYFEIPCHIDLESDAREIVDTGTLAYWPKGNALCIFFGRTPVSTDQRPRAYSPVNVFGRIIGEESFPEDVTDGALIKVSRYDQ